VVQIDYARSTIHKYSDFGHELRTLAELLPQNFSQLSNGSQGLSRNTSGARCTPDTVNPVMPTLNKITMT
jgi:hypothetical protein